MQRFASPGTAVLTAVLVLLVCLLPDHGHAQDDTAPGGWLRPTLVGTAAGLGLAMLYINPEGEGRIATDETFLGAAVLTGITLGLSTRAISAPRVTSGHRPPRLRVAVGTGGRMDHEYALTTRIPVTDRWALGGEVLLTNAHRETRERQTRCGWFLGCHTGDFVVDAHYQQSITLLAQATYDLAPTFSWHPSITGGGGLLRASVEDLDDTDTKSGIVLDAGVALERGGRTRGLAQAGYRVVAIGQAERVSDFSLGGWYARLGFAFGF